MTAKGEPTSNSRIFTKDLKAIKELATAKNITISEALSSLLDAARVNLQGACKKEHLEDHECPECNMECCVAARQEYYSEQEYA